MNIYERIKYLREKAGISQQELAEKVGYQSRSTINKIESGLRDISQTKLKKFADALSTTPSYLMGWTNDSKLNCYENLRPADPQNILVPKLGNVAAGSGCLANNEIIDYVPFEASSIKSGHEYMCLDVHGDSMFPMFLEGDTVLVQCETSVDSGKIAVVTVNDDEGVIKKVVYGDDWIELHSINPMYPVRRFEGADVQKIKVMGLVTELKRKF